MKKGQRKVLLSGLIATFLLSSPQVFADYSVKNVTIDGKEYTNALQYERGTIGTDANWGYQHYYILPGEGLKGTDTTPFDSSILGDRSKYPNLGYALSIDDQYIKKIISETNTNDPSKANLDASNLSDGNVSSWQNRLGNGAIEDGNTALVTGDTVFQSISALTNNGINFSGTTGVGHSNLGDTVSIVGGNSNITTTVSDNSIVINLANDLTVNSITANAGNIKNLTGDNATFADTVKAKNGEFDNLTADIADLGTVTVKELKINGESYITPDGLNANNKTIINVADGVNPTDAVNKRQLDERIYSDGTTVHIYNNDSATKVDISGKDNEGNRINRVITGVATDANDRSSAANVGYVNDGINALKGNMDQGFNKMNKRISDVGANSAALAGLHPVDFDPDYKLNVAAAYGQYDGSKAAAIGAFYRPNENIMLSSGVTLGNETMFNVGVSAKFGSSSAKYNNYRNYKSDMDKMAREYDKRLADMQRELDAMKAKNTVFDNLRASFPDVPADHWANEAVEVLHGNGVLEGYPDGEFKGNKSMTRYEYAEMLYRAMERGNKVPQSMIDEYKPELDQVKATQKNSSGADIKVTRETANTSVTPESVGLNAEKLDAMVKSANKNADKPIVLMSNGNAEMAKKATVIRDYLKSHGVKNTILLDGKVF